MKTEKYFPSNGTDGMLFIEEHCENCYKYSVCTILTGSMVGKRPKQWIYGEDGNPTCTSFKSVEERNRERKKKHVKEDKRQAKLF